MFWSKKETVQLNNHSQNQQPRVIENKPSVLDYLKAFGIVLVIFCAFIGAKDIKDNLAYKGKPVFMFNTANAAEHEFVASKPAKVSNTDIAIDSPTIPKGLVPRANTKGQTSSLAIPVLSEKDAEGYDNCTRGKTAVAKGPQEIMDAIAYCDDLYNIKGVKRG